MKNYIIRMISSIYNNAYCFNNIAFIEQILLYLYIVSTQL